MPASENLAQPASFDIVERLNAISSGNMVSLLNNNDFNGILDLACIICNCQTAVLSIADGTSAWFNSNLRQDAGLYKNTLFHNYTINGTGLLQVNDTLSNPLFNTDSLVTGTQQVRFYAGYTIINKQGKVVGALGVFDKAPKVLLPDQVKGLQLLAAQVADHITERSNKAELQNFEKHFEFSTDLVFIGGKDGYFQQINPAFETIFGWSKAHMLKTSSFEFLHPGDIEPTMRQLNKLTLGEKTVNFLQRFKTITGSYKTIQWTSTPEPETGRIFGIGRDVTEKQALELQLKQTQDMLQQTSTVAAIGGWSLDVVNKILYWSPVTKAIHAVPDDFVPDLITGIDFYKEGPSREKIMSALQTCFINGKPWDLELQIINAKGKELWVRALGSGEFENGQCVRVYGTFQDINNYKLTEQALKNSLEIQDDLNRVLTKQIELVKEQDKTIEKIRDFEFLADTLPQMIWTTGANGIPDYFNRHWYNYTGLSAEQSLSEGWGTILHPDDVERSFKTWNEAVRTGKPYEVEYRFKRAADGAYKWHLGRGLPMADSEGKIIKWFGSCTDIDEYKRALDLENKISQYEDFNRIVAHNLRGPSGSIKMLLALLMKDDCDVLERKDLLTMLSQSSEVLNDTLDELMKVLEVRTNRNLPFDDCSLNEITENVERMLKGQIKTKNATITTNFECQMVKFPKIYLESIFYNIISNALKYNRVNAAPQLFLRSYNHDGSTILSFKDNGLGIDLNKHGNDLFKLNKVFHRGFDSKGVGLFMTKTQIETFGGRIWVESEPNVGSEFFIEL